MWYTVLQKQITFDHDYPITSPYTRGAAITPWVAASIASTTDQEALAQSARNIYLAFWFRTMAQEIEPTELLMLLLFSRSGELQGVVGPRGKVSPVKRGKLAPANNPLH